MHISASMMQGAVCPVTLLGAVVGLSFAAFAACKADKKSSPVKFAAVTAMIFALQMLNFSILHGTSGHLLGGVLAVVLLGVPFAVLSISLVLVIQAVFFGDGGINALGANIINMAFLGSAAAGIFLAWLKARNISKFLSIACASWVSVVISAAACSFEIAAVGTGSLNKVVTAMLSVYGVVGLAEGLLTVLCVFLLSCLGRLWQKNQNAIAFASFGLAGFAALVSPWASRLPDGLEYVVSKLSFGQLHFAELPAHFSYYEPPVVNNDFLLTISARFLGIAIIVLVVFTAQRFFKTA